MKMELKNKNKLVIINENNKSIKLLFIILIFN